MSKFETFHGSSGTPGGHGTSGPIQVSRGTYSGKRAEDDFIRAAASLGGPEFNDLQDLDSCNGTQRAMRYVGPDGRRQDTAHAYLHPRTRDGNHLNLHVLVEHQVTKVLIEKKKAVGIEFRPNPLFQKGKLCQTVKARRLVILSSGALGSPSILERSGVGHPDILGKADIKTVVALSGVGNNYQDHHLVTYSYRTTLHPNETVDGIITGRVNATELIANNSPILGWNAQDITCELRPSAADVAALGPDFQDAWNKDFRDYPDKPLILMAPINGFPGDPSTVPVGQYFSFSTFSVYPYSRGSFHVNGPGIDDGVTFRTGFLANPRCLDIKKHVWAYKTQREIMRRMKTYRGEVESSQPPLTADSAARPVILDASLPDDALNIVYTPEDDAVIEEYVRGTVSTTWHSPGTCKMAPLGKGGVVDKNLSVYGVQGLKIADLSIAPENVAANTANTAMTIGEKAATIFIKELKLETRG